MRVMVVVVMATLLGGAVAAHSLLVVPAALAVGAGAGGLLTLAALTSIKVLIKAHVGIGAAVVAGAVAGAIRSKRSVGDPALEAEENQLLSAASQMDDKGCVLKLLCLLEVKEAAARTQEENILVTMFSNQTDAVTSYNAAFVYAADLGAKNPNAAICESRFSKCSLSEDQLQELLKMAWGCGAAQ